MKRVALHYGFELEVISICVNSVLIALVFEDIDYNFNSSTFVE